MMRALAFLFFVISLSAFGQTSINTSPDTPAGVVIVKGQANQLVAEYDVASATGATWQKLAVRFDKITPASLWNAGNVNNYLTNIRIADLGGNTVVGSFNPGSCNPVFSGTAWECEVVTSYTLTPNGSTKWRVFIDVPLSSPLTFIKQGLSVTAAPNVQITGAGMATIPSSLVQGNQLPVQAPPPEPTMNLAASSPTSNINLGEQNKVCATAEVVVGSGSGTIAVSSLKVVVEKSGGNPWTIANVDDDFQQIGVFDSVGNVLIPKANPSGCSGVAVTANRWECTVGMSYGIPAGTTRNFDVVFNVAGTATATSLRCGFGPTASPNVTLPGGGNRTLPNGDILGNSRAISAPPQPTMTLSPSSPTGDLTRTNNQLLFRVVVTTNTGTGTALVNTLRLRVVGVGTNWTPSNVDNDFQQVAIYDDLGSTVAAELNPSTCISGLSAAVWECTLTTSYSMPGGMTRTWDVILDVPGGATATSLQGSFGIASGNVTISTGGTWSLPTTEVTGAARTLSAALPDPVFDDGFED